MPPRPHQCLTAPLTAPLTATSTPPLTVITASPPALLGNRFHAEASEPVIRPTPMTSYVLCSQCQPQYCYRVTI